MVIEVVTTGVVRPVEIIPIGESDYKRITKKRFWFDWKEEKGQDVYKLQIRGADEILGLLSIYEIEKESRIEIRLLAVSEENRGHNKTYDRIAANLIAFACKTALLRYGEFACVSLIPKIELVQHYIEKYNMFEAGISLCLDGRELINMINTYDHD